MAAILRLQNKDGSVSFQAQVRIKRGGKILLNESRNFKVDGTGPRAEAAAKRLASEWGESLTNKMQDNTALAQRALRGVTVGSLIAKYIAYMDLDKPLARSKRGTLNFLAKTVLADVPVAQLTGARIISFARERRADGTKPQTINQYIIYLGVVLRQAKNYAKLSLDMHDFDEAVIELKAKGLIGRSAERERRLQESELAKLLSVAQLTAHKRIIPIAVLIRFAIETAMRLGEIVGLRWADLDEKNRTIIIRDRKDPQKKLGNNQTVPLLGQAFAIIQAQPRNGELIFPFKAHCASTAFTRLVARSGVNGLCFHDLRHEGISRLFEQGYQIQEVALISGHRSWKNLARYTQLKAVDLHRDLPIVLSEMSDRVDRR